jgi:chemotaxis protein CheD
MTIRTVLGSCVAVCLHDKTKRIGGMNHYLIPVCNESKKGVSCKSCGLRCAEKSIHALIDKMIESGCKKRNLEAKVFGGANPSVLSDERLLVGKRNVQMAKKILKENNIKIVAGDTGGSRGRKIIMKSDTGKVYLEYLGGK